MRQHVTRNEPVKKDGDLSRWLFFVVTNLKTPQKLEC